MVDFLAVNCETDFSFLYSLVKPEVMHELVGLVTLEPTSESSEALQYKYNNIAAELFSCDVSLINDTIVSEDNNFLAKLCEFIYNDAPLNPLMASFFSKTMAVLISRKADKVPTFNSFS